MAKVRLYLKQTITYQLTLMFLRHMREFLETFGEIAHQFVHVLRYIFTFSFLCNKPPLRKIQITFSGCIFGNEIKNKFCFQREKDSDTLLSEYSN